MKEKIALLSVLVNFILAVVKIIGGLLINSASVLAEGFNSGMDIFSSVISFVGIKTSEKPIDENHPYGHYKFEVLGGLAITIIIFLTGVLIIHEACQRFLEPVSLELTYLGLAIMLFSAVANEIMARLKIHFGKKENSVCLLSDGIHSRVDVFSSVAVLFGLILANYWVYADSLLAVFIGLYVIAQSFPMGKEAVDSLLDVSAGSQAEEKIKSIVQKHNIEISSLKTQKKGSVITANLEIKLPSDLSVEEATKTSDNLRERLIKEMENLSYVAIEIKSHKTETAFYKPAFGRGFGWQKKDKLGPGGYCFCPECGEKISHQSGAPCSELTCLKCKISLRRQIF